MPMPVRLVSLACQARRSRRLPGPRPAGQVTFPVPGSVLRRYHVGGQFAPARGLAHQLFFLPRLFVPCPAAQAIQRGDLRRPLPACPRWPGRYLTADSTSSVSTPPTSAGCRNAIAAPIDPCRGLESSSRTPPPEMPSTPAWIPPTPYPMSSTPP